MKGTGRVTVLYVLFGGAWILLSDSILAMLVSDPGRVTELQAYKDWAFVAASAILLYFGFRREFRRRTRAVGEFQESQQSLSTLLSNLPGMVYRCLNDRNWTMETVSEGCFELTGYQPAELIGNRDAAYADLIHPDERDGVWEEVQAAVEKRKPFQLEYRIRTRQESWKWVWEQGRGLFADDGSLVALEGFITGIDDRKRVEEVLRRERDFNTTLIQSSPVFFVAINAESDILLMNEMMLNTLGYTLNEVVGKNYLTTFVPEVDREMLSKVFERLAIEEKATLNENRVLARDGRERLVEWHGRAIFKENGELD